MEGGHALRRLLDWCSGWHRLRAARRARLPHILAEVRPGGRKDALRFALGCNQAHGLRRSNADKRRCVEIALRELGTLSDRLVAEMCGVSQPFVSNIRQQLITVISSKPRLGKDGKMRAVPFRETNGAGKPSVVAEDTPGDDGALFMEVAEALEVEQRQKMLTTATPKGRRPASPRAVAPAIRPRPMCPSGWGRVSVDPGRLLAPGVMEVCLHSRLPVSTRWAASERTRWAAGRPVSAQGRMVQLHPGACGSSEGLPGPVNAVERRPQPSPRRGGRR